MTFSPWLSEVETAPTNSPRSHQSINELASAEDVDVAHCQRLARDSCEETADVTMKRFI
jgi:hypothetical protein